MPRSLTKMLFTFKTCQGEIYLEAWREEGAALGQLAAIHVEVPVNG